MPPPVRTLIIDDSALVRRILSGLLSGHPEIEVVGTAADPYVAREKILELHPDVLTLDLQMPKMDGLTFLSLLMKFRPMPVIVLSSISAAGSAQALEALQLGAVDVVQKPGGPNSVPLEGASFAAKILAAAQAKVRVRPCLDQPETPSRDRQGATSPTTGSIRRLPPAGFPSASTSDKSVILFGASTGGTEALKEVFTSLPAGLPGICAVQHIPPRFSKAFAERLNQICPFEVREAQSGEIVRPGLALIAPGGYHLLLRWTGLHYRTELNEAPPLHHQRPAVDALFQSVAKIKGADQAAAILLTGMGVDGAAGMLELKKAGAFTVAQNEASCVVFGMPREAIALGAAQEVLPLHLIAARLVWWAEKRGEIAKKGERI